MRQSRSDRRHRRRGHGQGRPTARAPPAYGVGVGNSVHVVDETGGPQGTAAVAIAVAKTFDYATSCPGRQRGGRRGEHLQTRYVRNWLPGAVTSATRTRKTALQKAMWPDGGAHPGPSMSSPSPASTIAALAGFTIPAEATFLIVEEDGRRPMTTRSPARSSPWCSPFTPTPAASKAAIQRVNAITGYQGLGHTCGIHTSSDDNADALANGTKTGRVMVNQNLNEGCRQPPQRTALHAQPELRNLGREHHQPKTSTLGISST